MNEHRWSAEELERSRALIFGENVLKKYYKFLGLEELKPGSLIIDVGCGSGYFDRKLFAEKLNGKCRIIGLDSDENNVRAAKLLAQRDGWSSVMEFHKEDIFNLTLDLYERADLTFSHTLVCNLPNPQECIKQKIKITKIGGIVADIEPDHSEHTILYPYDNELTELENDNLKAFIKVHKKITGGNLCIGPKLKDIYEKLGLKYVNSHKLFITWHEYPRTNTEEVLNLLKKDLKASDEAWKKKYRELFIQCGMKEEEANRYHELRERYISELIRNPDKLKEYNPFHSLPFYVVTGRKF